MKWHKIICVVTTEKNITYLKKYSGMTDNQELHHEYFIRNDNNEIERYDKKMFKKIEEYREEQINKIIE